MTATSLGDLHSKIGELGIAEDSLEGYSNALINLASNYENCSDEIIQYQNAL
jgi:hypothetical protein